jgi:LPXTG-motif cell wall-anchored protein
MRRVLLLAPLLLLLLLPAQARAGELIDRAVEGLRSDNVYVDPEADPTLSAAEADALRDRIVEQRAGPMYVVVAPAEIAGEAGGDPARALGRIGEAVDRGATYVIVAGRTIRALSGVLDRGEAGELAAEAIDGNGGDLSAILLDFTDRVGEARTGGGGGDGDGDGAGTSGLVLLGLLGAGGAALLVGRRRRRARDAAEFEEAKRNARDDLVALGDDIRALDIDVQMPNVDPEAKADYDHAVARYTEAEDLWERARTPGDLAPVGSALEEGRWAMASAKARFSGETPPERRPPCFFDPRHGPSSRDVLWSPPYGEERPVPACEADAQRVERGDEPQAREVEWAGRRVPYWQAGPAYAPFAGGFFGGFGGGLLPGILIGSLLGGAMSPGIAYGGWDDGGGGDGGGDFGGGGFGGDFGGGDFGGGGGGDF